MNCECKRCDGSGEIKCPSCEGRGMFTLCISEVAYDSLSKHKHSATLIELRADAMRLKKQVTELSRLKPRHAAEYQAQLEGALGAVNQSANKLLK